MYFLKTDFVQVFVFMLHVCQSSSLFYVSFQEVRDGHLENLFKKGKQSPEKLEKTLENTWKYQKGQQFPNKSPEQAYVLPKGKTPC